MIPSDQLILSPAGKLARVVKSRPRLFWCIALGLAVALGMPSALVAERVTRAILGWNVAALLYAALACRMMFWTSHERMKSRAQAHDEGAKTILALVALSALACIGVIIAELAVAKDYHGLAKGLHIGLAAGTIATSWIFTQIMFALHYAHDFYAADSSGHRGGLEFPGGHTPDYGDFLYFACVIGTSGQTADVSFTSRSMRRVGLAHCVLAFFFNTTLLALTINIGSGLV